MVAMLRKMREHVEKNFENVGERFPEEARRIHYGEAEEREIFRPGDAGGSQGACSRKACRCARCPDLPKLDG